jgi:phosphoglucomutase
MARRVKMTFEDKYKQWINSRYVDEATKEELKAIKDTKELEDRFYKELEFGTGGLRGVIGAGSNRMNIYTVGKATQGLASYLKANYSDGISVCIAYDSRIMSREFADTAAVTLCGNGINVKLFDSLRPTPMLSFAVGFLGCKAGIVITASHNPKQYNGYKVYGEDGGQVTDTAAKEILGFIEAINDFSDIKNMNYTDAINSRLLQIIGEEVDKEYIKRVKSLTIRKELVENKASDLKVIYTPIHGAGNIPVRRVLRELGYSNLNVVKQQENPDGSFPTVSYPNPENPDVFNIALDLARGIEPDIIFGTDPDCDRIGVVVKDNNGCYKVLTGNQTGVLLSHYIISSLKELQSLPDNGTVVKTIVTTDMVKNIAKDYKVSVIDVLTGFKYIGEKIKEFGESGSHTYLFGFEESYGYLAGDFVRDKDAVIAAALICEMALYYKSKAMNLYDALMSLYEKYGYYREELVSMEYKGKAGQEQIGKAMDYLRHSMNSTIGTSRIVVKQDYKASIEKDILNIEEKKINLPKSNVLKFITDDDSWFVVRPSGTEPKMKIYFSVKGNTSEDSELKMKDFKEKVMNVINMSCRI